MAQRSRTIGRIAALIVAAAAAPSLVWWGASAPLAAARADRADFDDLLALAAAGIAATILAWCAAAAVLTALAATPGALGRIAARCTERLTPIVARRIIRAALGLAAAAPTTAGLSPAVATPSSLPAAMATASVSTPAEEYPGVGRPPVPRIVVDRPGTGSDTEPDPAPPPGPPVRTVTVAPGDSLWAIAAHHLGPDAGNRQIAAEWPRWFAANRDEIGPDPDHIVAGTTLHVPPPVH